MNFVCQFFPEKSNFKKHPDKNCNISRYIECYIFFLFLFSVKVCSEVYCIFDSKNKIA